MDGDEGEICRVCRCEATEEEPLFYPCKCSGSIRYVHQSCLSQWLSHSRKNYCELCKHPFSFTPIYANDMPENLPIHVLIYRGAISIFRGLTFLSRCCLTGLFWLVVLPYLVLGTFRLMINLTDKGAVILAFGFLPSGFEALMGAPDSVESYYLYLQHLKSFNSNSEELPDTFYGWSDFWGDCFKGQIITVVVVSIFLILFLLREWAFHAFPQLNTGAPLPGENPPERRAPEAPAVPIPPIRNMDLYTNPPRFIIPVRLTDQEQEEYYRERNHRRRAHGILDRHRDNNMAADAVGRQVLALARASNQTPMPLILTSQNARLTDSERLELAYYQNSLSEHDAESRPAGSYSRYVGEKLRPEDLHPAVGRADLEMPQFMLDRIENMKRAKNAGIASSSRDHPENHFHDDDLGTLQFDEPEEQYEKILLDRKQRTVIQRDSSSSSDEIDPDDLHDESDSEQPFYTTRFPITGPTPPLPRSPNQDVIMGLEEAANDADANDRAVRFAPNLDFAADREEGQQAPIPPPVGPDRADPPPEIAEEAEELFGDEINGVAEFIGLRGDPLLLFQYAMMIYVLVAAGLWGFIGLPYLIGRFMLLLELSTMISFPAIWFRYLLGVVRLITDPLTHFFLHSVVGHFLDVNGGNSPSILDVACEYLNIGATKMVAFVDHLASSSPPPAIGPHYSWVWAMYNWLDALRLVVATSDSVGHRVITVGFGYFLVSIAYFCCINFGEITNPELLSIRRIIYVMTKIAVFILLEIMVFPFLCGLLLDYVTLPLFGGATVASRARLFTFAPLGMTFLHWISGTAFFFLFSVFMTQCRRASRRGLLWFIRDPNEANPQPVREMISRSVKDQIYRLGVSAVVYALIIFGGVGLVVSSGKLLPGNVLPLRLSSSRPYHEVSFDLVILELLIPALVAHFQPQQLIKAQFLRTWSSIAAFYRLTNFITGHRVMAEEYSALPRSWRASLSIHRPLTCTDYLFLADGSYRRTPNSDTVTIVPGRRMVVHCHRDGRPIDPLDVPSDSPIYPNANVCIAYAPPNFALRIAAFILTVSLVCDIVGWFALYAPLVLGRYTLAILVPSWSPISDLYSYNLGFVLLWLSGALLYQCYTELKSAWKAFSNGSAGQYVLRILSGASKLLQQAYLIVGVWCITPLTIALLVDMYIHTPLRAAESPTILASPHWFSYMWSIGATLLLMALRYSDRYPNSAIARSLPKQLSLDDLANPQPLNFSARFLIPYIGGALYLYYAPVTAAGLLADRLLVRAPVILQWYTSGCLYIIIGWLLAKNGDRHFQRWRHSIRDDEYLIGQALNNIRPRAATTGH
ncbi:hypothetical protein DSO57_1030542 [Entomophthora muscae]|uniref:Uncharacterized protein n=1 Tax=Entomophthora muscae TaxID=34485 RepID=A0ACC2T106_9FUNG|nr:hypothetical protein DSO57_1030542 [Entomophthora muscae]